MGFLSLLFPWGIALQAIALVHFIRHRPETIWLWVILFLGPVGAIVYLAVEVVPDFVTLRSLFDGFGRRTRIRHLEALVAENPSPGNYEELGDLYLDERRYAHARDCYDKVLARRADQLDPRYRRGLAALHLGDFAAAAADLEAVTARDPRYDAHRALGLLAHACANAGDVERAAALFEQATAVSTLSETYYNYASFLAAQQRTGDARAWAERIVARRTTIPRYLRRREQAWFRKAEALLKRLPRAPAGTQTV